ncbi:MAG: hypothetical protein R2809_01495 [Flavobacteriales bacterium]
MNVLLRNSVSFISDELILAIGFIIFCYLFFIGMTIFEKSYSSTTYKVINSIFGFVPLIPVFIILVVSNGNGIAMLITIIYIATLVIHLKKLKYRPKN